jgi:predicted choloylglycine hydrolase
VTGLSRRGFAIALNAVSCSEPVNRTGYPVLLALRAALEDAQNFEEAVELLSAKPLAAPALITVVGDQNAQRVVIERTPRRQAQRWANGDEPLVATNHYRQLNQPETYSDNELFHTTCARYQAMENAFVKHRPDRRVEDAELLYVLSDSVIIQSITAQHIILRPRVAETRLFVPRRFIPA